MFTREVDSSSKQEADSNDRKIISKASSSSTSASWSRLKDPRIVRVSRAFGGKDRHSKVCTVRGLRDRRVRLSVPTAIQLYDLQDRLGLNQPSKVVDWLLTAAKHEIDELPPLHIPPGNFSHNLYPISMMNYHGVTNVSQSDKEEVKTTGNVNWDDLLADPTLRTKSKEVATETNDDKNQNNSFPGLLSNNAIPYSSFLRWDPSNLSLSYARSHGLTPPLEDFHNLNVLPLPSAVSPYPPGIATQYLPSHITATTEFDPKQIHFQVSQNLLSNPLRQSSAESTSQSVRPFHLNMTTKLLPSQNSNGNDENKDSGQFHI